MDLNRRGFLVTAEPKQQICSGAALAPPNEARRQLKIPPGSDRDHALLSLMD